MKLSVVVIVYDMNREAPRTLRSLAPGYQRKLTARDYEVIVVDNGSPEPLGKRVVRNFGRNFRYIHIKDASASPVEAVNIGVSKARGQLIGIWVDGARISSPGLLQNALEASAMFERPVVGTFGFHLGPKAQQLSIKEGYDKEAEDRLLNKIGFPECDYRLFEVSSFAGSSKHGFFVMPAESNALFIKKKHFNELNGFDARFDLPGGGHANHDFFKRAVESKDANLVVLLGEGTFHQLHGGISTNVPIEETERKLETWLAQYKAIRGTDWESPQVDMRVYGHPRRELIELLRHSAESLREIYS